MLLQQKNHRSAVADSGWQQQEWDDSSAPTRRMTASTSMAATTIAAPDPVGFSPVRVTGRLPSGLDKGAHVVSPRCCDSEADAGSLNTAPTEFEDEAETDLEHEHDKQNGDVVTRPTLLSPSVAWSWYKPKSGTRSLFEMDDDDDDEEEDIVNTRNKAKVMHVGNCPVTCLSPPELVASTTAESFDFSEVGWGNNTAGKPMSPLRRAAPDTKNQALVVSEFAFAWKDSEHTSPMAWMQPQLPRPSSQQLEQRQSGSSGPEATRDAPQAANLALESPTPSSKPSCLVQDIIVSPLAMESPLAKSRKAAFRRQLSGEARSSLPPLTLNAPPVLVTSCATQGRRQSQRTAAQAPASPGSLPNRRQSRSYWDLRQAVADSTSSPASLMLVMAASDNPATTQGGRRRSAATSTAAVSPKINRRRASASAEPEGAVETKKTVRTIKVRAKDLASLVGGASSSPAASPSSAQQGSRRRSSAGKDLKAVWDALRKVRTAASPARSPSSSSSTPDRRLVKRSNCSRRVPLAEDAATAVAGGDSKSSICAVAPAPVRSRSRSCSRRIPPPPSCLGRSASVGTGLTDARGRTATPAGTERTSRSRSRPRRSETDRVVSDGQPDKARRVDSLPASNRRTTKGQGPDAGAARDAAKCSSTSPVRRSRSFEEAPTASPTHCLRRSSSMGSCDNRQRFVRPGQVPPTRRPSVGSVSPGVGIEEGRRRRPSLRSATLPEAPDEDPRRPRRRRRSSSRQRRAPQAGTTGDDAPAPSRRRSESGDFSAGSHRNTLSSPAPPGRQSSVSPRPSRPSALGVPGTPPARRRTGSDAAREAGFTDEQLRRLQDAGFHISPRRRGSQ